MLAGSLADTVVLQARFDPEATPRAVAEHEAEVLVVVPVMLARILALEPEVRARYDTSSLKIVFASGSALGTGLAREWMDMMGENLFNLYGSTEVAWAAIATPEDTRGAGDGGTPAAGDDSAGAGCRSARARARRDGADLRGLRHDLRRLH